MTLHRHVCKVTLLHNVSRPIIHTEKSADRVNAIAVVSPSYVEYSAVLTDYDNDDR